MPQEATILLPICKKGLKKILFDSIRVFIFLTQRGQCQGKSFVSDIGNILLY